MILPGTQCTVTLGNVAALGAVKEALRSPETPIVGVFPVIGPAVPEIGALGTLALVRNLQRGPQNGWTAELHGFGRGRRHELLREEPFPIGQVEWIPDGPADPTTVAALIAQVRALVHADTIGLNDCQHRRIRDQLRGAPVDDVAGVVTSLLPELPAAAWQELLEADNAEDRLALVLAHLSFGSVSS
jgi:Lon protease-like protein